MVHMCAIPQACTSVSYDMIVMNMMGGATDRKTPRSAPRAMKQMPRFSVHLNARTWQGPDQFLIVLDEWHLHARYAGKFNGLLRPQWIFNQLALVFSYSVLPIE
jgi:hypothetical protein